MTMCNKVIFPELAVFRIHPCLAKVLKGFGAPVTRRAEGRMEMDQHAQEDSFVPTKRNLTLCVSDTASNPGSRGMVRPTVPLNSCSIRANSSAIRRGSSPEHSNRVSVGRLTMGTPLK